MYLRLLIYNRMIELGRKSKVCIKDMLLIPMKGDIAICTSAYAPEKQEISGNYVVTGKLGKILVEMARASSIDRKITLISEYLKLP